MHQYHVQTVLAAHPTSYDCVQVQQDKAWPRCPLAYQVTASGSVRKTVNAASHTWQLNSVNAAANRGVACAAGSMPRVMFFGRQEDPDLTVAKLQVGVFGPVDRLQQQLDHIAGVLDGDDEEAMGQLVHDIVVLLSRNLEYCAYAHTALFMTDDFDELEQKYNQACLKERTKFKQETLSNVGGRYLTSSLRESGADVGLDKWLTITLIMAAEDTVKLPKIRSLQDLRETLSILGSLSPDLIVAVELLWTPQETGDSYSRDEMLADYPQLVTL
eukprot:GHRR01027369.1.p1 GENE.GHRR01027369.1~~GHRR01027369.1.p1  ORF type:complete len:272 (+),score=81.93 GHRR01027369.1:263-1078(+)